MINRIDPRLLALIGFILMLVGCMLPLLIILKVLQSTFFLAFLSYGSSLLGLMLGLIGIILMVTRSRRK